MANTYRILAAVGAALVAGVSLPPVSKAEQDCGPGMYFNDQSNQCEWSGPAGPGPAWR
jgi:hypothetical protein